MKWYFYTGLIAAICIAVYMMPQLIKIIKTKDTTSISILMVSIAVAGDVFFVISGIGTLADKGLAVKDRVSNGLPLFLANLFGCVISAIILFFKIRNIKWSKKFGLTEAQIPSHYKEIKTSIVKARAEKRAQKLQEKEDTKQGTSPVKPPVPGEVVGQ